MVRVCLKTFSLAIGYNDFIIINQGDIYKIKTTDNCLYGDLILPKDKYAGGQEYKKTREIPTLVVPKKYMHNFE